MRRCLWVSGYKVDSSLVPSQNLHHLPLPPGTGSVRLDFEALLAERATLTVSPNPETSSSCSIQQMLNKCTAHASSLGQLGPRLHLPLYLLSASAGPSPYADQAIEHLQAELPCSFHSIPSAHILPQGSASTLLSQVPCRWLCARSSQPHQSAHVWHPHLTDGVVETQRQKKPTKLWALVAKLTPSPIERKIYLEKLPDCTLFSLFVNSSLFEISLTHQKFTFESVQFSFQYIYQVVHLLKAC